MPRRRLHCRHCCGAWNGAQVVPRDWVAASVTPDAPHVRPGARASALLPMGYGYQWWVPDNSGVFSAIGVYNQFVWVDPASRTVIAKTSAFRRFASTPGLESYRIGDHFALFGAIAKAAGSAVASVASSMYDEYKEPLYAAPPLLQRMVDAGRLGRKSGSGFYAYA